MHPHASRPAFTMIEMLIVTVLILILISMLLPAVQQTRESARRFSCQNNLTQIGLAIKNHESAQGCLPPGVISEVRGITDAEAGRDISFLLIILPFLEQQSIHDQFQFSEGAYADGNRPVVETKLWMYQCPSDNPRGWASNYVGCHHHEEAPIDIDNTGLLFLNSAIRFRDIVDGRANTILLGEKVAGGEEGGWAVGTNATLRNTGSFGYKSGGFLNAIVKDGIVVSIDVIPNGPYVGGFSSRHHGAGANFCFADGAVNLIQGSIDPVVFQNLGHRADGSINHRWD